jgi:hypothetical protein
MELSPIAQFGGNPLVPALGELSGTKMKTPRQAGAFEGLIGEGLRSPWD